MILWTKVLIPVDPLSADTTFHSAGPVANWVALHPWILAAVFVVAAALAIFALGKALNGGGDDG